MFILPKLHICKFEKKTEKLFREVGRELTTTGLRPAAGQVWGVAVRYTRLPAQHVQNTRLLHSFASGFSGHFASLVVSKKVPPTYGVFDFVFLKLKLEYFPIKSFLQNG